MVPMQFPFEGQYMLPGITEDMPRTCPREPPTYRVDHRPIPAVCSSSIIGECIGGVGGLEVFTAGRLYDTTNIANGSSRVRPWLSQSITFRVVS